MTPIAPDIEAFLKDAPGSVRRGLKAAYKGALLSTSRCHRVGAALFRGNRLITISWNSTKSHPSSKTIRNGQHAEFSSLMGQYKYELCGATIYVIRLTRRTIGIAKPCKACEELLYAVGVKKVVYTDRNGKPQEMRLRGRS